MRARAMSFGALLLGSLLAALPASTGLGQAIGTSFTYQGRLDDAGAPASGVYDLQFRLFTAAGVQVGPTVCSEDVGVTAGAFSVPLDFGAVFDGTQRLLEISVRPGAGVTCSNAAGFTTLSPRQSVSAGPYALYALTAASAAQFGGQPASFYQNAANLSSGTLPSARLAGTYSGALTLTNAANVLAGSGAALTALNAGGVSTGTLADARLSANVALRGAGNTFTAANTFAGSLAFGGASFSAPLIHAGGTQIPLQLSSTNIGGTWLTLANSSAGAREWDLISSGSGNGEGAGKLLVRDAGAGAVRAVFDSAGFLGLGTISPATRLDVAGVVTADGLSIAGTGTILSGATGTTLRSTNSSSGFGLWGESSTGVGVHAQSSSTIALEAYTATGGRALYAERTGNGNKGWLGGLNEGGWAESTNNIGFVAKTANAGQALYGERTANGNKGWFGGSNEGGWAQANTGNGMVAITADQNNAGLYCRNDGLGLALNCDGRAQVKVITILGGADLAEQFPVSETAAAEPGTVMAIDPDHPGRMQVARGAYCKRVAGVISGASGLAAGMVLSDGPPSAGDRPIALSGRVWVKCTAEQAAIEPGDLLTTADAPGLAMRAADRERAYGAVIGKAMSGLKRGEKGLVLVLVNLQ